MKAIGYQNLIELFGLPVREPVRISWVRPNGSERKSKHEGINLDILAALLAKAPVRELTAWVKGAPTSRYCRIAWFLYEWTSGKTLPIADLRQGNYLPVLDEKAYYCPEREEGLAKIRRQRLVNNLPGTPAYCPMVRRTALLRKFEAKRLDGKAKAAI